MMNPLEALWSGDHNSCKSSSILLPQPLPLSQPAPPDSDEVLHDFLQEMAELDRQQVPATPEPKIPKRQAADTPRPAKKVKQTPVQQSKDKKPATTRWHRRKLELQTLKEQAETLSSYVSYLQHRTPGQLLADSLSLPPELDELVQFQAGGWHAAAIREIRRCQASLKENEELKQRLQACVQVAGTLQTALKTANTQREEILARDSIAARALRVELMMNQQVDGAQNALIYDMLEAHVNARVHEVQTVVNQAEVSQPVQLVDTDQVSICRKDDGHAAVEFKTVRVLPFDVDTVSNVCWRVAELGWTRRGARVERRSRDVVSSDWCFPVQLDKGETVEIRVRCVAKRFKVPEGFVVLAESTTEWPAHLAASGAWSRVTRERGWGLVHSYPGRSAARSPSRSTASVSRFMMHMTTEPSGLDSDTSRKLLGSPAVSDIVVPSFRTLIKNRQQCVDNRLMDAAFASPSIAAV